jgi:hypothetical protein
MTTTSVIEPVAVACVRTNAHKLTFSQVSSLVIAQTSSGTTETECGVCCEIFTKQRRKPIICNACNYTACYNCYKQFLTSDGVSRPKCMNRECNTEWTIGFLRSHFTDAFISGDLREHTTKILFQQQVAMLAATQPAVERRVRITSIRKDILDIDQQMNELLIRKRILQQEARILERGGEAGNEDDSVSAAFHHKCCDPECLGFVSSAWKCGLCEKFSCTHCREVKGTTKEEVDAHVCNADSVETVKFLKTDTKPCPGCGTYIHKTEGCDQMFCTHCKQLWSWNTGRIEERGHNPHYLEWMRNRAGAGGGPAEILIRDPADVQCGREIDWRFNNSVYDLFRTISRTFTPQDSEIDQMRIAVIRWSDSIIHLRHHDVPHFRTASEIMGPLENLRISYMLKQITESHFRLRIFQIHRSADIHRQILDLLVAMQNAATDILYRIRDTLLTISKPNAASQINIDRIREQLHEMDELREYAKKCIFEIYSMNGKAVKYAFIREHSFALTD